MNYDQTETPRMSEMEQSVHQDILDWAATQRRQLPVFAMMAEAYWREVHGIEI